MIKTFIKLSRLDKPIGIWLLLLPALWAIFMAGGLASVSTWYLAALFTIGAVVMRSAGCIVNDIWDKNIDAKITRTAKRPIAAGEISRKNAALIAGLLLAIGAIILFQLNWITIALGFATLPLIALYPLMKRITWWPQLFLGLTFSFSALMGWSATTGSLSISAFLIYFACIFWTLAYDTIYAHQDFQDDKKTGVRSTALLFKSASKVWVSCFYAATIILLAATFSINSLSPLWLVPAIIHVFWQMKIWNPDKNSGKVFAANRDFGLLVLAAAIGGSLL